MSKIPFLDPAWLKAGVIDTSGDSGTSGQILSSTTNGVNWIDQSTIASGSAEVVEVPVKNLQGSALTKGDPVYISGSVGTSGILEVQLADASNAAKMPAVGLLKQDLAANAEGFAVVTGKLRNLVTSPIDGVTPNPNTVIYVKSGGSTGAALTTVKPTGVNFIQNMGKVGRVSTANDGTLIVSSILRSNDVPTPLYIDHANQRLGIGVESPSYALDVVGDIQISDTGLSGTRGLYGPGGTSLITYNPTTLVTKVADGRMIFDYNSLDFELNANVAGKIMTHTASNSVTAFYSVTSERMRIDGNGNVGIGTTNPGYKLEVNGDFYANSTGVFDGDIECYGSQIYSTGSLLIESNGEFGGDLTVSGGDIILGGTGRIQGIDTVSAGTDAVNKTYVDNGLAGKLSTAGKAADSNL